MLQRIHQFLLSHRYVLFILFLIHLYATYYSFNLYASFIQNFPYALWIFVPTCTVALGLFAIAYFLYWKNGKVPSSLALYCVVAGISYGLVMVILYPVLASIKGWYLSYIFQTIVHLFFALEALMFIPFALNSSKKVFSLVMFWFILKAFSDMMYKTSSYLYRTYPHYLSEHKFVVYVILFLFQLCLFGILYLYSRNKECRKNVVN
jgi:uncharacterized membrane protein YpjA